jgi:hypothetical protein
MSSNQNTGMEIPCICQILANNELKLHNYKIFYIFICKQVFVLYSNLNAVGDIFAHWQLPTHRSQPNTSKEEHSKASFLAQRVKHSIGYHARVQYMHKCCINEQSQIFHFFFRRSRALLLLCWF